MTNSQARELLIQIGEERYYYKYKLKDEEAQILSMIGKRIEEAHVVSERQIQFMYGLIIKIRADK